MARLLRFVILTGFLLFLFGAFRPYEASAAPTWRLVAPVAVSGVNLATRSYEAGALSGGVGIGLDLGTGWYAVTPMVAATAKLATAAPNAVNVAALIGFAKYGVVGTMVHVEPAFQQWYLLAGVDLVKLAAGGPAP